MYCLRVSLRASTLGVELSESPCEYIKECRISFSSGGAFLFVPITEELWKQAIWLLTTRKLGCVGHCRQGVVEAHRKSSLGFSPQEIFGVVMNSARIIRSCVGFPQCSSAESHLLLMRKGTEHWRHTMLVPP